MTNKELKDLFHEETQRCMKLTERNEKLIKANNDYSEQLKMSNTAMLHYKNIVERLVPFRG